MSSNLIIWIILAPLFGAILNTGFYFYHIKEREIPQRLFSLIGTISPMIAFVFTLILFLDMKETGNTYTQDLYTWLSVGNMNISMKLLADNLSIFMSMFITFVGSLIHVYAVGYMD